MSRSIHVTKKIKGLTKSEIDDQANDPDSDLNQWAKKKESKRKNKNQMTKINFFIISFFFLKICVHGQVIGFEQIDDSKVKQWIPKLTIEYQYVYHFGDSEMESDFLLLFGLDSYYGQIKSSTWSDDGKSWIWIYKNLTNIRIEKNKFYSDQTNGEFVIYDNGQEKIKGLKIDHSWSGLTKNGEYEIGTKSYPIDDYFNGKFPQASKRLLSKEELIKMTKLDLKVMRNEIFARYGYKFKPGREMDKYFKSQDWYTGQHDNVNYFLTEVEKENIKLIQQIESK